MSLAQSASLGSSEAEGVDFNDVFGILARRKLIVLGFPLVLMALALAYSVLAHPQYTAMSEIYVDPRKPHVLKDDGTDNSVPGDGMYLVESQLKIITSDEVLLRTIDKLNLKSDPEFASDGGGLLVPLKALLGMQATSDKQLMALRALRSKVLAKKADRSFVIDIMAAGDTREKSAAIANGLADAYFEEQAKADADFAKRTAGAMSSRLDALQKMLRDSEDAVESYKAAHNLVGTRTRMVTAQQLDEVSTNLTAAKAKLGEAQSRVKLLESLKKGGGSLEAVPEAVQSATIAQLRAQAAQISRDEALMAQQYGPNHPSLVAAKAQQRDIQAAIDAELGRIAQAARNEASRAASTVSSLQATFENLKTTSQTDDKASVELRELERKADANRGIYESFLQKAKLADEQQVIDNNNSRVISHATLPEAKSWPPSLILLGAALFGGGTLGVAFALMREFFANRKMAGSGPARRDEAHVPPGMREEPVAVEPKNVAPQLAEPRAGRAPIEAAVTARPPPLPVEDELPTRAGQVAGLAQDLAKAKTGAVLVLARTAGDAGEPFALDLAKALNLNHKNIILLDADFTAHPVSDAFGFAARPGLREVLAGKATIYDVARYHRASNLNVVPCGVAGGEPAGDDARAALKQALASARDFDLVIVDAGAFDAAIANDALFTLADDVIVTGDGTRSSEAAIARAQDALTRRKIKARSFFLGSLA